MKTTTYNISLSSLRNNLFAIIAVVFMGLNFASCTSSEDEPTSVDGNSATVSDAQITFTYTVPEELFKYAEITVCRNNNEGTDAVWYPMLDNKITVTYNLTKFPVTAPVILVYDTTNRPAYGIDVDWDITMDVEVSMNIGGQRVTKHNYEVYNINGDLGAGIDALMKNVLDRTYAVKLSKRGDVQFVH